MAENIEQPPKPKNKGGRPQNGPENKPLSANEYKRKGRSIAVSFAYKILRDMKRRYEKGEFTHREKLELLTICAKIGFGPAAPDQQETPSEQLQPITTIIKMEERKPDEPQTSSM